MVDLLFPLRGHRDDAKYHGEVGQYSVGQVGNFVELLNYRVRGGDEILGDHMRHAPKNATNVFGKFSLMGPHKLDFI